MSRDENKRRNSSSKRKSSSRQNRSSSYETTDYDDFASIYSSDTEDVYTDISDKPYSFSESTEDDYFSKNYGFSTSSINSDPEPEKSDTEDKEDNDTPKRKDLTRKQRKRRIFWSYTAVFVVIVLIAMVMSFTVLFKTTEIVIEGDSVRYEKSEIIDVSGLKYSENIFLAKRKAAVKNIVDNFPYIESAEVKFKIPGTQVITITAAVPSYQVSLNGEFATVSSNGRVLDINKEQQPNIPLLKGLKITYTEVGQYISFEKTTTQQILAEVIDNINENEVPNIYGIDISNSANIKLNYDNRITILLGMPEDVGYKLRTAMVIINEELAANDKGDLDVSLANSDRKSSYFTPIYSNTVNIEGNTSSKTESGTPSSDSDSITSSISSEPDRENNGEVNSHSTLRRADESKSSDSDDYLNDIIDEYDNPDEDYYDYEYDYDYNYDDYTADDYNYNSNSEQTAPEEVTSERTPNIISDYGTNYYY